VEPVDRLFAAELPGERTPLLGIVPGTKGGFPGSGATGEVDMGGVGVGSGADIDGDGAVGADAEGVTEGLKALGVLSFPHAVVVNPSTTSNKAIFG
jgi:hypothetical protein